MRLHQATLEKEMIDKARYEEQYLRDLDNEFKRMEMETQTERKLKEEERKLKEEALKLNEEALKLNEEALKEIAELKRQLGLRSNN